MSDEAIKIIDFKGLVIKIFQDPDPLPPDDGDKNDSLFLVHYHRDFEVRRDEIISKDDLIRWYNGETIEAEKVFHIFLTKAYIHSGITLALEESGRTFPDERWDVSRCGCVLVRKTEAKAKKKALKMASQLIERWNDCLSGNVYGYMLENKDGEVLDSCWGFYGDFEKSGLIGEAKEAAESVASDLIAKHLKKLKYQIKNDVPLEKRSALNV